MELKLPPEIEATIRERAATVGMPVDQFAVTTLKKGWAKDTDAVAEVMLPREEWKATFDELVASFPRRPRHPHVDCSRESIYGDRGR